MKHDPRAIQDLKSRLNIADIVKRYVSLKNAGGRLVGLCPFHNEKTASFGVNPEKGFFHCFGCQASGDVIDFYCRINGLDFREGLEQLALETGITLAEFRPNPQEEHARKLRQAAGEMHAYARDYFRDCLRAEAGAPARDYLYRRGVSAEMVERFQLGYSPPDWQGLEDCLKRRGYRTQDAVAAGLLSQGDGRVWDRFRGRLMFPIHEVSGKVVAFGGRVMGEGEPKYLNSADSPVYKKGEHLYGLNQARPYFSKSKEVLLTEGYLDVIALHQHGFPETCGVLGTALTGPQVKRLTGFCQHVTLVFDGDPAGEKAALRSAQMLLAQGASCRVVLLPQGEDADSLLKAGGPEAFRNCLDNAREGLDFCLATVRRIRSSKEVVDWALAFLDEMHADGLKAALLTKLAHGLSLAEHELRQLVAGRQGRQVAGRQAGSAGSAGQEGQAGAGQAVGQRSSGAGRPPKAASGPAKKDAEVLEFAIRAPGYIPALEGLNVFTVLATDRARAFWKLLAQFGQYDVLPYLDERQKSFWGKCASKQALTDQEAANWFEDITAHVARSGYEGRKRGLIEAMRDARDRGDGQEEQRLASALNDLLWRHS